MVENGGYAFPQQENCTGGMTLRDWFAGEALSGLLSNPGTYHRSEKGIAKWAYTFADKMLAIRSGIEMEE